MTIGSIFEYLVYSFFSKAKTPIIWNIVESGIKHHKLTSQSYIVCPYSDVRLDYWKWR